MTRGIVVRQLIVIITALLIPVVPFVIIGELPGDRWLSAFDEHALLFALTGGGLLALDILLPVPSSILGTLLGARLGLWPGFFATWLGLCIGNAAGFGLARFASAGLRDWLPPFPKTTTQVLVFLSRPVPVFAEAVALAAGATRMPPGHFLLAIASGNALYALVLAGNGAALLPGSIAGPGLVVPMLLPVVAWLAWRRLARPAAP
ncbi:MAG: VTT domain-containing protein [Woeseiaceae bacterium]|nr:VTT domain-containing protein [Woeseiaceae bacterium]